MTVFMIVVSFVIFILCSFWNVWAITAFAVSERRLNVGFPSFFASGLIMAISASGGSLMMADTLGAWQSIAIYACIYLAISIAWCTRHMRKSRISFWFALLLCTTFSACSCGARTGLEDPDAASADGGSILADAGSDAFIPPMTDAGTDAAIEPDAGDDCAMHPVMPGDLVQGTGPAVYYVATSGRRYVFPNEDTYYSWFPDFSGVCRISDADLAAIPIGGNVMIRPGTFLVKITTDPKVYAISPGGLLHWVETETVALDLYGPTWAHQVQDVPDAFFINYTIGASLSMSVHPDGQLVTYAGSSDIYLIEGGRRRLLAPGAFEANSFQLADPRDPTIPFVVETAVVYPDGAPITGRIPLYAEPICEPCP